MRWHLGFRLGGKRMPGLSIPERFPPPVRATAFGGLNRYFELPVFKPPQIDPAGTTGIPHLGGSTRWVTAVLKDKL